MSEYKLPTWAEPTTPISYDDIAPEPDADDPGSGSEWLPKTDWSRDGIIASDD